jgi:phosphoglycolate phosphatase
VRVHLSRFPLADAVLFDHDGTLIDSLDLVVAATNAVLVRHGAVPRDRATVVAGMVLPTGARLGALLGVAETRTQAALAEEFYRDAADHVGLARPYSGVPELIRRLRRRGVALGCVTSNQGALVRVILRAHGLDLRVWGEEDIPQVKPSPSGLLLAARTLGVPPAACTYVGDSLVDAAAATAAGMMAIGVTWGTHTRAELAGRFHRLVDAAGEIG